MPVGEPGGWSARAYLSQAGLHWPLVDQGGRAWQPRDRGTRLSDVTTQCLITDGSWPNAMSSRLKGEIGIVLSGEPLTTS